MRMLSVCCILNSVVYHLSTDVILYNTIPLKRTHHPLSSSLLLGVTLRSSFHRKKLNVITNFNPIANHKLAVIVVSLDNPPAVIAPRKRARNAAIRRLRFGFAFQGLSNSFGSTSKSQNNAVKTTVGISSYARTREATIWPAAWKARSAIGRHCIHCIGARGSSGLESTAPSWTRSAAARMAAVWMPKERTSVERRRGWRARDA